MNARFAAVAILALCASAPAHAATISFTDQVALSDVEITGTLSVPRFDPSLGMLVGVTYEITGAIASVLGITNSGTASVTGTATTTVFFEVDSVALPLAGGPDFSVVGSTGPVTLGMGESALFPVVTSTTISGAVAPGPDFLSPGNIDLSFFTITNFGGAGFGGDIILSQATDAGISFSMTYAYDVSQPQVIPLPASGLLLVGGLGALGLARRRLRH